jgi:hypothetical protein
MTQPPPPGRPSPYPDAAATGVRDLGRVAFVVAIIAVVLGIGVHIAGSFLPVILMRSGSTAMQIGGILGAFTFLHAAISFLALGLGALAAQRRQSPLRSGIAIGVGAVGVIGGIVALLLVPVAAFWM